MRVISKHIELVATPLALTTVTQKEWIRLGKRIEGFPQRFIGEKREVDMEKERERETCYHHSLSSSGLLIKFPLSRATAGVVRSDQVRVGQRGTGREGEGEE